MPRDPQTGQLHLPKDIGVATSTVREIETRWNTISKVDEWLQQHGFAHNPVPEVVCPIVSAEALMNPDVQQFTVVFSAQLRWYNYVTRLHADVRAVLLQVENEMSDIETAKRIHFRQRDEGKKDKDKMAATEMKDLISQDPHYRELRLLQQELQQQNIKLAAWCESLDRNLKTVSRQIENRRAESQNAQREANMPGHSQGRWESRFGRPVGSGG
jgi:hypothetical protein